jgi:hypothetical protein
MKCKHTFALYIANLARDKKTTRNQVVCVRLLKLCTLVIRTLSSPKAKAFGYFLRREEH